MELIVSGIDKFQATKNYEASAQFIKAAMVRPLLSYTKKYQTRYAYFVRSVLVYFIYTTTRYRTKSLEVHGTLLSEKVTKKSH